MIVTPVDRSNPTQIATYSGHTATFPAAATPTDVFVIGGAANIIVKVLRMWFSGVQTTAGVVVVSLIKRNAANSGGTAVATTKVPHDSIDAAGAALVQHYTANPTINGTVGNIWNQRVDIPAAATAGIGGFVGAVVDFSSLFGKPIVLRGTAEQLALNLGGATLTGLSAQAGIEWTEEST